MTTGAENSDMAHLRDWIGREETASEPLTAELIRRYNATFDLAPAGTAVPSMIHHCLAPRIVVTARVAADGHPEKGDFLPPVPLPRRMWAGGEMRFHQPLRIGDLVTRKSRIADVTVKHGKSGILCFVAVDYLISTGADLAITERHDIVYRSAQANTASVPLPEAESGVLRKSVAVSPVLLFRYSALTFNSHRIHYDHPYVTEVEHYPGLVVHGPLQAALLLHYAAELRGGSVPAAFRFRSHAPLFATDLLTLNASDQGSGLKLWTARADGSVGLMAEADW